MSVATASSPTYDLPRASTKSSLSLEPWYHGMITRRQAEALVHCEGDFLVRDSISSPTDFVLTVFWKGRALHFQINKIPSPKSSTKFFFQFEDEQFESVSDLIVFYRDHRIPVTLTSGCNIINPVPNSALKSFDTLNDLEENYMKIGRFSSTKSNTMRPGFERCLSQQVLLNETRKQFMNRSTSLSTSNLTTSQGNTSPTKKQHFTLSSLLSRPLPIPEVSPSKDDQEEYCEMDYDAMEETPPEIPGAVVLNLSRRQQHSSMTSLNSVKLSPTLSMTQSCYDVSKLNWRLPRTDSVPSLPERKTSLSMRDSGFVTDASDYDHPLSYQEAGPSGISEFQNHYESFVEDRRANISEYAQKLRTLMAQKGLEHCALLITQEDCRLLRFLNAPKISTKKSINGLALILLPQGAMIREELIERTRSLQFICVLTTLSVPKVFQSKFLSQWIGTARSLLYDFGNLFSFLTIVSTLCSKPIAHNLSLWKNLEESVAVEFHSKLVPLAECLRKGGEVDVSNVTIPLIQPILDLLSKTPSSFFLNTSTLSTQIDSFWKWLEMARDWSLKSEVYQKLATSKCGSGSQLVARYDNLLSVECYYKYLFGQQQVKSTTDLKDRYEKLMTQINTLTE